MDDLTSPFFLYEIESTKLNLRMAMNEWRPFLQSCCRNISDDSLTLLNGTMLRAERLTRQLSQLNDLNDDFKNGKEGISQASLTRMWYTMKSSFDRILADFQFLKCIKDKHRSKANDNCCENVCTGCESQLCSCENLCPGCAGHLPPEERLDMLKSSYQALVGEGNEFADTKNNQIIKEKEDVNELKQNMPKPDDANKDEKVIYSAFTQEKCKTFLNDCCYLCGSKANGCLRSRNKRIAMTCCKDM